MNPVARSKSLCLLWRWLDRGAESCTAGAAPGLRGAGWKEEEEVEGRKEHPDLCPPPRCVAWGIGIMALSTSDLGPSSSKGLNPKALKLGSDGSGCG